MRTRWLPVAVLLGVSVASPARAGVYFPADPTPWPLPTNPRHFQDVLGERKNVVATNADVKPMPLRKHVEKLVEDLAPKSRRGNLTVEESINLGAEWAYRKTLALRVGYQSLFQQDSELGLTAGAGVAWDGLGNELRFDYAWASHSRLGSIQRVTLGVAL